MKSWMQKNKLYFIGALPGAIAGFIYWKYVGCLTGTCAITSNSIRNTIYGALVVIKPFQQIVKKTNTE